MGVTGGHNYAEYVNVPHSIGAVVSSGKASLKDLGAVLGAEDLYDLLEIIAVDAHNQRLAQKDGA